MRWPRRTAPRPVDLEAPRDGVRRAVPIEAERLGNPRRHRIRTQQFSSAGAGIFRPRQHGADVVARMAGFAFRQKAVVEIQAAHQGAVVESRPVRRRPPPADQRRPPVSNSSIWARIIRTGSPSIAPIAHPRESNTRIFSLVVLPNGIAAIQAVCKAGHARRERSVRRSAATPAPFPVAAWLSFFWILFWARGYGALEDRSGGRTVRRDRPNPGNGCTCSGRCARPA